MFVVGLSLGGFFYKKSTRTKILPLSDLALFKHFILF